MKNTNYFHFPNSELGLRLHVKGYARDREAPFPCATKRLKNCVIFISDILSVTTDGAGKANAVRICCKYGLEYFKPWSLIQCIQYLSQTLVRINGYQAINIYNILEFEGLKVKMKKDEEPLNMTELYKNNFDRRLKQIIL